MRASRSLLSRDGGAVALRLFSFGDALRLPLLAGEDSIKAVLRRRTQHSIFLWSSKLCLKEEIGVLD
jgi:hypothetical protein